MAMQIRRTATSDNPPTGLVPGQLAVEMADPAKLWVGVPTAIDSSGRREIGFPDAPADGISYLRKDGVWIPMTHASAALTATVTLLTQNVLIDGPSIDVGNQGTWFVAATAVIAFTGAALSIVARIWDGFTIIADIADVQQQNWPMSISLSGIITNPIGPLKLSVAHAGNSGAQMVVSHYNTYVPSTTRQTSITAVRIG